jgi:uncharacterized protein (DUF1330 family)
LRIIQLEEEVITTGHVIIVFNKKVVDLHFFKKKEYEHLMDVFDAVIDAMFKVPKIKKIYLIYIDEPRQFIGI